MCIRDRTLLANLGLIFAVTQAFSDGIFNNLLTIRHSCILFSEFLHVMSDDQLAVVDELIDSMDLSTADRYLINIVFYIM